VTGSETSVLQRRSLILEYATIGWNVGEAVLTIALGSVAGSLALLGFGTVSVVAVLVKNKVVWHLRSADDGHHVRRTVRALRLIAIAFGVLALALALAAIGDLVSGRRAGESQWGIAYLALTALVMFTLARMKKGLAMRLGSGPLRSEARVTFLDGVLSTTTLAGLALNAYLEVWWADPLAGLLVALAAGNEARGTWRESDELS